MQPETEELFNADLRDVHLVYDYEVQVEGKTEYWKYEMWFFSKNRIVYKIHGGPMAGRANFQTATYQCIRPGELWQCNWLEETGTIVSLVYDVPEGRITTMLGFSKGHWENPEAAHGDKRNAQDLQRWRGLAREGIATDRHILCEQARVKEVFRGAGELEPIDPEAPTM